MNSPRDKAFPVSWDQFHRDARALAWRLAASGPFNAIVAITRGGLVPAAIVARELEVRVIETVSIASYHDYKTQGGLKVLKTIAPDVSKLNDGAKILIVDDLVDTGATAKLVREMLPRAHFATVYAKPLRASAGRHLRHRSVAGHLDLFPLGHGARLPAADRQGRRRAEVHFRARNVKQARYPCGRGETGRRKGLKIPFVRPVSNFLSERLSFEKTWTCPSEAAERKVRGIEARSRTGAKCWNLTDRDSLSCDEARYGTYMAMRTWRNR